MHVEISLRLPNISIREKEGREAFTANNTEIRFKKVVDLPQFPKNGEILTLETPAGPFLCHVVRSDWNEDRHLFVISCQYGKRSISRTDYEAFLSDPTWELKPLI
jgi:hypothetical protein